MTVRNMKKMVMKMTENKRFNISLDNNQNIYDAMLKCYYSSIDAQKLCSVLNELYDENQKLKNLLKSIADKNGEIWLDGQIIRLKKVFNGKWTND